MKMQHDMTSPQISFILPVYNVEPYLAECLDSILKHNISKEIIIIDDGSQDRSFEIAQDYFLKHPEIVLYRQHNRGVSAARNAGLRLARGKWLNFTDPDDWILEPDIAQMLALAEQHDIDVFRGMVQRSFEENDEIIVRPSEYAGLPENAFVMMYGYEYLHLMLAKDWFANANFGFYKTAFLRQHGFQFHENISMSEDGLWMLDILTRHSQTKVMEMGRLWYNYRIRANSALTSKDNLRGIASAIQAANIMREKAEIHRERAIHATSAEENAIFQQIYWDWLRAAAVTYGICYRFLYLKCSDEGKAKTRHHFTPDVVHFMEQFLPYPVVL